jgi:hypothetical protein
MCYGLKQFILSNRYFMQHNSVLLSRQSFITNKILLRYIVLLLPMYIQRHFVYVFLDNSIRTAYI